MQPKSVPTPQSGQYAPPAHRPRHVAPALAKQPHGTIQRTTGPYENRKSGNIYNVLAVDVEGPEVNPSDFIVERQRQQEEARRRRFDRVWDATQRHHNIERETFNEDCDLLVISENLQPENRTGQKYPGADITKTYYPGGDAPPDKNEGGWVPWDWTSEDFPDNGAKFDLIIARSMVCACEDEHFAGGAGPFKGPALRTCGGTNLENRKRVLNTLAGLLKNHGGSRAYLTVSPRLHYQEAGHRKAQRDRAEMFWKKAVGRFNQESPDFVVHLIHIERGDIPVRVMGEKPAVKKQLESRGTFFGFEMVPKKKRRRRRR